MTATDTKKDMRAETKDHRELLRLFVWVWYRTMLDIGLH